VAVHNVALILAKGSQKASDKEGNSEVKFLMNIYFNSLKFNSFKMLFYN
jgi:hypothetical protein